MSLRDTFTIKPLDVKLNTASVNVSTQNLEKSDKGEIVYLPGSPAELEAAKKKQNKSIIIAVIIAVVLIGGMYFFTRKKAN